MLEKGEKMKYKYRLIKTKKCELCEKEDGVTAYPYYRTNNPFIDVCKECLEEIDNEVRV